MNGSAIVHSDNIPNETELDASALDIKINQDPENDSLPFLSIDSPTVQLGDKIQFIFGMENRSIFYAGYNYSIFLTNGSIQFDTEQLSKLENYTLIQKGLTQGFFAEVEIDTLDEESIMQFTPGNYTTLLLVNSTNRGLLNTTLIFEIVVEPGANINVLFANPLTGATFESLDLIVNETKEIAIILVNNGLSNAFNVTLDSSNLNEPVGLTNITLPVISAVIGSFDRIQFNFSVYPTQYGIGEIQFILRYSDALSNQKNTAHSFELRTLPHITGQFSLQDSSTKIEYIDNDDFRIIVDINYIETFPLDPLIIKFSLTSSKINFLPEEVSFNQILSRYNFNGIAIQPGLVDIVLSLTIFDPLGSDQYVTVLYVQTFELIEVNQLDKVQRTFEDLLPIIAILLYFLLIAGLAILYFRTDIRKKFFERVLGLQLIEHIKYKSTSVVIDGSNIAWEQQSNKKKPMIQNIKEAYNALKEYGFKDIVIIADAALRYQIDDQEELDKLVVERFIKLVPAKVNADGFILRFSAENGFLILSNDLYKEYRDTYTWVDERRIPYTILDDKFYLHPTFE